MNYYYPYPYSNYSLIPPRPAFMNNQLQARTYPPIDVKTFTASIKSFQLLMSQGNILLNRLSEPSFAHRIMSAAQHGKKAEVDQLIKSIGLKVPIKTRFTPSGVVFELVVPETQAAPISCCTLSLLLKW